MHTHLVHNCMRFIDPLKSVQETYWDTQALRGLFSFEEEEIEDVEVSHSPGVKAGTGFHSSFMQSY